MTTDGWQLELHEEVITRRLRLRWPEPEDAAALVEAAHESWATGGRWMSWLTRDYGVADAQRWIEACGRARARGDAFEYLVFGRDGRLFGGCSLTSVNRIHRFANLGYWIRTSAQGDDLASESARALAKAGIVSGELARIEIVMPVDHLGSQRVAEKVGARREAILRSRVRFRGEPRDAVMYSLVKSDL